MGRRAVYGGVPVTAVALLDQANARALVRRRLDSRAWWAIPFVSTAASRFSVELESRYFAGPAGGDFEAMLLSFGGVLMPVTFAAKRRVGIHKLADLMVEFGGRDDAKTLRRELAAQDVLVVTDGSEPAEIARVAAILERWNLWLFPERRRNWWN